jgi:lambda repressor-like predicted transcriptional regulator
MVIRNHIFIVFYNKIIVANNHKGGTTMNDVNHALALRIGELLKKKGITRYRLAMNSGVTHSTLKNIIHETVKDNLLSTTILIASGFDMTVSEFLDRPLFLEENLNI